MYYKLFTLRKEATVDVSIIYIYTPRLCLSDVDCKFLLSDKKLTPEGLHLVTGGIADILYRIQLNGSA